MGFNAVCLKRMSSIIDVFRKKEVWLPGDFPNFKVIFTAKSSSQSKCDCVFE